MSERGEQQAQAEEPLEQGPVSDAGSGSDGEAPDEVVVEATAVEDKAANGTEADRVPEAGSEAEREPEADSAQETDAGTEVPVEPEPPETPLQRAERERGEYLELAQRSRAEFENFRRRAAAQSAEAEIRGKAELARRMVPALDNLERALLAAGVDPDAESPAGGGDEVVDALAGGVNLVLRELRDGLRAAGVEGFNPAGERFDPNLHEAIATGAADGAEAGTVIETTEKGYRIGEQVLRPARVVVAG
ncbi:MAG: nucleotide exchange factor GrpE [Solirubrobacterales bacterium]